MTNKELVLKYKLPKSLSDYKVHLNESNIKAISKFGGYKRLLQIYGANIVMDLLTEQDNFLMLNAISNHATKEEVLKIYKSIKDIRKEMNSDL